MVYILGGSLIGGMYMDFRRIDEETVQCILSEEEMNSYGFQIDDFFSEQEKARSFLEHLVELAEEEIGYEAKSGMVSMQIMKMPNNDLVITLSERDPGEAFQHMLRHLQQQLAGLVEPELMQRLHSLQEEEDGSGQAETDAGTESISQERYQQHLQEVERQQEKKRQKEQMQPKLFCFESFHALSQFALSVSLEKPINSAVFWDSQDENYYLLLKKGRLKREEYVQLCEKTEEFATLYSSKPYVEQFCQEHFERFLPKQAIRILKQIETGNRKA
jgi:adapter protein MecA 1/2